MTATLHTAPVVVTNAPTTGSDEAGVIRNGAVLINNGVITDVGPAADLAAKHASAKRRDHAGVLTPGLVNAHSHLQYAAYADLASSGLPFSPWIAQMVERRMVTTDEQWAESARAGAFCRARRTR